MTDEKTEQNVYYCGYDCDTMVNNVLVFGPDGKVFFCAINYLGSWSNGTLTTCFFSHIKERIGDYKICVERLNVFLINYPGLSNIQNTDCGRPKSAKKEH
jgi:hypothetical protein